jgi:sugar phosphate isomerase/epimerase
MMKLSLSARIAEEEHRKDTTAISFEELANLAHDTGFSGLCIRPSQATVDTPKEVIQEMRAVLDRYNLKASMVTLDPIIATNTAEAGRPQREIGRHLDYAEILGAALIRIAIKNDEDVKWTRTACDEAAERKIMLLQQTHTDSPAETIDGCLDLVKRIDHPSFGLTVEPGNLVLGGEEYGPAEIKRLAPHVINVYLQNLRPSATGEGSVPTNRGEAHYERLVVGEEGGIDAERFFSGLKAIGYDGFVTTHQPSMSDRSARELAEFMAQRLSPHL